MADQKQVQKLMSSEMTRREFLGFLGAALIGVVGITGIIKGLNGAAAGHQVGNGYGSSPYGGGAESRPRRRV
jgi:hypothetical protein